MPVEFFDRKGRLIRVGNVFQERKSDKKAIAKFRWEVVAKTGGVN